MEVLRRTRFMKAFRSVGSKCHTVAGPSNLLMCFTIAPVTCHPDADTSHPVTKAACGLCCTKQPHFWMLAWPGDWLCIPRCECRVPEGKTQQAFQTMLRLLRGDAPGSYPVRVVCALSDTFT